MEKKNTWETYGKEQLEELEVLAKEYMGFLDEGKTERECVDAVVNAIEKEGYRDLNELMVLGAVILLRALLSLLIHIEMKGEHRAAQGDEDKEEP